MAEGELIQQSTGSGSIAELSPEARDAALGEFPLALVITDPSIDDNPIIYANRAFTETTGYSPESVIGRNCRFLQGPDTESAQVDALREAIAAGEEVTVDLTNYRASGERFRNRLTVTPLRDDDDEVVFFLGVQLSYDSKAEREIAELQERLRELNHRVKNHLGLIVAMIRVSANSQTSPDAKMKVLSSRVEALSLLYEQVMNPGASASNQKVMLGSYLSRVCSTLQLLGGRKSLRINTDIQEVTASFEDASRYGLLLSELLTNAMQHAFEGREGGAIEVSLTQEDEEIRLVVSDDGKGMDAEVWESGNGVGSAIASELVARLDGTFDISCGPEGVGTTITVTSKV